MRIVKEPGVVLRNQPTAVGMFVVSCDVDAQAGLGEAKLTYDVREAMKFEGVREALEYYQRRSKVRPIRLDGQPNRPLTAYTVEIITVEDAV